MRPKVIVVNERNDGGYNPKSIVQMPRYIFKDLKVIEFFLTK